MINWSAIEISFLYTIEISANFCVLQKPEFGKTWIQYLLSLSLAPDEILSKQQLTNLLNQGHLEVSH